MGSVFLLAWSPSTQHPHAPSGRLRTCGCTSDGGNGGGWKAEAAQQHKPSTEHPSKAAAPHEDGGEGVMDDEGCVGRLLRRVRGRAAAAASAAVDAMGVGPPSAGTTMRPRYRAPACPLSYRS